MSLCNYTCSIFRRFSARTSLSLISLEDIQPLIWSRRRWNIFFSTMDRQRLFFSLTWSFLISFFKSASNFSFWFRFAAFWNWKSVISGTTLKTLFYFFLTFAHISLNKSTPSVTFLRHRSISAFYEDYFNFTVILDEITVMATLKLPFFTHLYVKLFTASWKPVRNSGPAMNNLTVPSDVRTVKLVLNPMLLRLSQVDLSNTGFLKLLRYGVEIRSNWLNTFRYPGLDRKRLGRTKSRPKMTWTNGNWAETNPTEMVQGKNQPLHPHPTPDFVKVRVEIWV